MLEYTVPPLNPLNCMWALSLVLVTICLEWNLIAAIPANKWKQGFDDVGGGGKSLTAFRM